MSEKVKKKQFFPWRYRILLLLVLAGVLGRIWFWPRTGWSLKNIGAESLTTKDMPQTAISAENIRNVVLISIDTCRADHLSCYGYSRKTSPNIDAAAAEGVLFNHAVTPVPITLPAHSSMLTGTIPPYHKVHDNQHYRLGESNLTLAEILKENGFVTGAVIGSYVIKACFGLNQGFDTYNDRFLERQKQSLASINERKAKEVTYFANLWLQEHCDQKFFLFLHYFDPHTPYEKHKPFVLPFRTSYYDGEIFYTDSYVGKVIEKLKELNLYDSTLLIITADHGEGLGEHSEETHSFFIYHSTIHVPLIVKIPGGPKGLIINDVVGLIDIVPTVCASLGIPVPTHVQGRDLNAYFAKGGSVEKRYLYSESLLPTKFGANPLLGLVGDHHKCIYSSKPELYDIVNDPDENDNLAGQQPHQVSIMRQRLEQILNKQLRKADAESRLELDEESRARLESLGYIAAGMVDESFQFDQNKADPKDLIELYTSYEKIITLITEAKYDKAKDMCADLLADKPDLIHPHFILGKIGALEGDNQAIVTHFSRYLEFLKKLDSNSPGVMRIKPNYAVLYTNLGVVYFAEGKTQLALEYYKKALSYNPYNTSAMHNLGSFYHKQGKLSEALALYSKALDIDPDVAEAHYGTAVILLGQGKIEKGIMHFSEAVNLKPDWPEAKHRLNIAKKHKEKVERTVVAWNESLRENPNQPHLHRNQARYFYQQDKFEDAIYHWEKALELEPNQPVALNRLAWILVTCPEQSLRNPAEALRLAEHACELTDYKNPAMLDTLSVAYAAFGRFDKAVETAEKAIELAVSAKQNRLVADIEKHLKLFKKGLAYSP